MQKITLSIGCYARAESIAVYRHKPNFGDLNVLVDSRVFKSMPPSFRSRGARHQLREAVAVGKNGPVLSVGLPLPVDGQCLQVAVKTLIANSIKVF